MIDSLDVGSQQKEKTVTENPQHPNYGANAYAQNAQQGQNPGGYYGQQPGAGQAQGGYQQQGGYPGSQQPAKPSNFALPDILYIVGAGIMVITSIVLKVDDISSSMEYDSFAFGSMFSFIFLQLGFPVAAAIARILSVQERGNSGKKRVILGLNMNVLATAFALYFGIRAIVSFLDRIINAVGYDYFSGLFIAMDAVDLVAAGLMVAALFMVAKPGTVGAAGGQAQQNPYAPAQNPYAQQSNQYSNQQNTGYPASSAYSAPSASSAHAPAPSAASAQAPAPAQQQAPQQQQAPTPSAASEQHEQSQSPYGQSPYSQTAPENTHPEANQTTSDQPTAPAAPEPEVNTTAQPEEQVQEPAQPVETVDPADNQPVGQHSDKPRTEDQAPAVDSDSSEHDQSQPTEVVSESEAQKLYVPVNDEPAQNQTQDARPQDSQTQYQQPQPNQQFAGEQAQQPVVYQGFWFAVYTPRFTVEEPGSERFELRPGVWIYAREDRGHEFLVQSEDGKLGVLRELDQIERAQQ